MLSTKKTNSLIPVRIGGLLIAAGFIRPDHMAVALSKARQLNEQLGEVLIASNLVTKDELKCALDLQQLIKAGSITVEMGARALKQTRDQRSTVAAALQTLGYSEQNAIKTIDLTSVLLDAKVLSSAQIEQASWNAAKNYLPLGRNLVLAGTISPSMLGAALNILVLLREKSVTRDQAIHALRTLHQQKIPLEQTLAQAAEVSPNHIRVGELLTGAGLLSESDAMIAVENGLLNHKSIGEVLLQSRMISPLVLDACLKLQKMISQGNMDRVQATELLRQVARKQISLEQFLNEMTYLKSRVLELLVNAGLITHAQIQQAVEYSRNQDDDVVTCVFSYGLVTQEMFRCSVRCVYAIDEGTQTLEQMIEFLRVQFASQLQQSA